MKTLPTSAATNGSTRKSSSVAASAVPTSTGATAAGSVRGRAASSHSLTCRAEPPLGRRAAHGRFGNLPKSGRRFSL